MVCGPRRCLGGPFVIRGWGCWVVIRVCGRSLSFDGGRSSLWALVAVCPLFEVVDGGGVVRDPCSRAVGFAGRLSSFVGCVSFVAVAVICGMVVVVCGHSRGVVGGRCCFWAVIGRWRGWGLWFVYRVVVASHGGGDGGWRESHVTNCDNSITHMKSHANDHMQMISCDDLGLVPWKSTRRSTDFIFFSTDLGRTLYGITRHNNKNTIPIIFHADSTGMSNSVISPVEFRDSSRIPGGIPGGE